MQRLLSHMGKMFQHSAGPNRFLRYEVDAKNVRAAFIFAPVGREQAISLDFAEVGKIVSEAAKRPIEYCDGTEKGRPDVKYAGLAEIQSGFFVRVSRLRDVELELRKAHIAIVRERILDGGDGLGGLYYR